jgi:hypothetical protein
MALAAGGLVLVFVARGAEESRHDAVTIDDPSAERAADPGVVIGPAAASPQAIRLLDFAEIDQIGGTCDEGLAGTVPRTISVTDGESALLDEEFFVRLEVDGDVTYGDLDGDGRDEAVVHTICEYGANGAQDSIQVWDLDTGTAEVKASLGEPPTSVTGPLPPAVKGVAIEEDGTLAVTWTHYSDDDPNCCPSLESTIRYLVAGTQITQIGAPDTDPVA